MYKRHLKTIIIIGVLFSIFLSVGCVNTNTEVPQQQASSPSSMETTQFNGKISQETIDDLINALDKKDYVIQSTALEHEEGLSVVLIVKDSLSGTFLENALKDTVDLSISSLEDEGISMDIDVGAYNSQQNVKGIATYSSTSKKTDIVSL